MVKPRLVEKAFMVRYADDAVIGCECKEDADRIMKVLALRFTKYGLTIHPQKTKLVDFRRRVRTGETGTEVSRFWASIITGRSHRKVAG
jgi:retron-type reverse transcriptase